MDSRLIAGAYSQHFRALEREEQQDNERKDSVTKAKRLSQETNKRRKFQAQKRKLEAQREERRRQDILTKRREEQKQATEKYQRSHIPAGSRQNSGRSSPKRGSPRRHLVPGLEDALKLIRKSSHGDRPYSGRDQHLPFNNENDNPMDRAYFFQVNHHVSRPSSGKSVQPMKYEATAQLMDYSMKNLTSSKSLFEQQLEHQQSLLLEQQHKSLKEFNDAIQKELNSADNGQGNDELEGDEGDVGLDDSCSSVDSLEKSHGSNQRVLMFTNTPSSLDTQEKNQELHNGRPNAKAPNNNEHFYLNQNSSNNQNVNKTAILQESNHIPLNIDLTLSATYQKTPLNFEPQVFSLHAEQANRGGNNSTHVSKDSQLNNKGQSENVTQNVPQQNSPPFQFPLKQTSADSIAESESSDSSISLVRIPDNNTKNVNMIQQTTSQSQKVVHGYQSKVSHPEGHSLPSKDQVNQSDLKPENKDVVGQDSKSAAQDSNVWASNVNMPLSSNRTRTEPVIETYNPRYASAIGLSIWPGQMHSSSSNVVSEAATSSVPSSSTVGNSIVNNESNSKSSKASKDITSTTSERPVSSVITSSYTAAPLKDDKRLQMNQVADSATLQGPLPSPVSPSSATANNFNFVKNEYVTAFNQQDFKYPLPQTSLQGHLSQNSIIPPTQANVYSNLQAEISQLSQQMVQYNQSRVASSPQFSTLTHPASNISQEKGGYPPMTHGTGQVPVPAVRTVFPVNRPPVPAAHVGFNIAGDEAGKRALSNERYNSHKDQEDMSQEKGSSAVAETSEAEQDKGAEKENDLGPETAKPLKGILKQLPPKVPPHGQSAGKVQARDSVELARMQNDKKARKKSVRFAEHHIEENFEEFVDSDPVPAGPQFTVKNSYKTSMIRPASAKVISNTAKLDLSVKQARSSSAGTRRPHPSNFSQAGGGQHTSTILPDNSNTKINLPANLSQPLNTSAPINRPKAAAHIILSSESQNILKAASQNSITDGHNANSSAATVHKSQLEAKVKTVNNNFMSKVPVKTAPKVVNSPMVYHVMRPSANFSVNGTGDQVVAEDGPSQDVNAQVNKESSSQITQPDRSRIRDPMTKKVPISNSTVTRTSIVPASTKINYPMSNGSVPSYSVSNAQGSNAAVFDENGLRVDRTPTDEEITWLWDKVRNCLDKEEEKAAAAARQPSSSGIEPPGRPTPVLSTKLIDGASLGFNSSGAAGLRPGSGYFYPRANSANTSSGQNKAKPIVQQQGSYLRRYGLLQQRRTNSASAAGQRGGSAGFVKYSTVPTSQQSQQQVLQTDMPTPMAFSYRPQDNVTESTAAFEMAERLVKQSLSDSHIAVGMDDAQVKQEVHNKAAKVVSRGGGPSALSMEEQKLMESLDKLNDRLKATEQKYPGTIHYHQPYQPHLPGFRGHQGFNDSRRPGMPQNMPPRSQSARIRQQIRQYR